LIRGFGLTGFIEYWTGQNLKIFAMNHQERSPLYNQYGFNLRKNIFLSVFVTINMLPANTVFLARTRPFLSTKKYMMRIKIHKTNDAQLLTDA